MCASVRRQRPLTRSGRETTAHERALLGTDPHRGDELERQALKSRSAAPLRWLNRGGAQQSDDHRATTRLCSERTSENNEPADDVSTQRTANGAPTNVRTPPRSQREGHLVDPSGLRVPYGRAPPRSDPRIAAHRQAANTHTSKTPGPHPSPSTLVCLQANKPLPMGAQ